MAAHSQSYVRLAAHRVAEAFRTFFGGGRRRYATLCIELQGELPESPPPPLWGASRPRTFVEVLAVLQVARCDPHLQAVLLSFRDTDLGWAQAFELRRSIGRLREAGKKVWAVLEEASAMEYVAASTADKIWLLPTGSIDLSGLAIEAIFFTRALEKLGVEPYVVQAGVYKSAAETFTRTSMSPAQREAAAALLDDLYGQLLSAVAQARGWTLERAEEVLRSGPFSATEALDAGLVDALDYPSSVRDELQRAADDRRPPIGFAPYLRRQQRRLRRLARHSGKQGLAAVHVSGPLVSDGHAGLAPIATARLSDLQRCFRELAEQPQVRAVVVRIDSPGGSAVASDLLWHELNAVARAKPVVVSLGNTAASGGYYLGLAGALILAESSSITGSIGVFSALFRLRGLYDLLGIDKDRVERGAHTALRSDYAPLSEEEKAILRRHAEEFYGRFTQLVGTARDLSPAQVEQAAGGRVWTGRQALELGLVDGTGGFEDALREAKQLAGYEPEDWVPVTHYPRRKGLLERLLGPLRRTPPRQPRPSTAALLLSRPGELWALLPFSFRIR